jgi:3-hydroxyisobutyrate dehydrogenase
LHGAGHEVKCFDTSQSVLSQAAERGMKPQGSVATTVEGADFVVSMLPSGKHVVDVMARETMPYPPDCVAIDCSTIDIASCASFHQALSKRGIRSLDAPVSGGVGGASAGTLTFMVGGSDDAFARGLPVLRAMGKNIIHAGQAGSGQAAKICNNLITGISMVAVSEALNLARNLGLDLHKFFDIASTSSGQCWSLTTYSPEPGLVPTSPANRDYEGGFASELMLKDLRLAEQAALSSNSPALLGAAAASLYAMHCHGGQGRLDFSSIIQMMKTR